MDIVFKLKGLVAGGPFMSTTGSIYMVPCDCLNGGDGELYVLIGKDY